MAPMPPPGPQAAQQASQESPAPPTSASPAPLMPSETPTQPQTQNVPLPASAGNSDVPPEGVFILYFYAKKCFICILFVVVQYLHY